MPDFTGATAWKDAFKSLSDVFDPSIAQKQAQAYYAGAEARKAQAEAARITDAQNWRSYMAMKYGPYGLPSPASPTFTPGSLPGFAPTVNAPANLPMSSVVAPGQGAPIPTT